VQNRTDWRLSFQNGNKHFNGAERSIKRFLERPPYTAVVGNAEPDTGHYSVSAKGVRPVPDAVRLALQDALANYRAALDQLVNALVRAYSPSDIRGSAFPIASAEGDFYKYGRDGRPDRSSGLYKIRGVSPEAFAYIEWLQPYQRGRDFMDSPLFKLNILRNVLHQRLHVVRWRATQVQLRVSITEGPAPVIRSVSFASGPIYEGAQIASVSIDPIPGLYPEVNMTVQPPFTIIFDPGSPLGQARVIDTMTEIRDFILYDVFPLLEPLL